MRKIIVILFFTMPCFGAINATQQWWIRPDGAELNGGGFDSAATAACGTNWSDQAAAQVTFNGSTISGATTGANATIVLTGISPQLSDICNVLRISAGTNFTAGYYVIIATGTASWIMDRAVATGVGAAMIGKMGGALNDIYVFSNGGSGTVPIIASPVVPGNVINIRGAGTNDPSSLDYTDTYGYLTFPSGDVTNGPIKVLGYNGRPCFGTDGLWIYNVIGWYFGNMKMIAQNATNAGNGGIIAGALKTRGVNLIFDANGNNTDGMSATAIINSWFKNTGSTSAGTASLAAMIPSGFNSFFSGDYVDSWRGDCIYATSSMFTVANSVIRNCGINGVDIASLPTDYNATVSNNTIDGCLGDGIKTNTADGVRDLIVRNTILSNNGGWGINHSVGTSTLNNSIILGINDYNDFYNNTLGTVNNASLGVHDLTLNPTYTASGSGNYAIGTNLKAQAWPGTFPNSLSTGYLDMGAVQRQESSGGGGTHGSSYLQ